MRSLACPMVSALLLTLSQVAAATNFDVAQGWNLFVTDPAGTTFPGLGNMQGVPIGTFDFDNTFGRGIGVQTVGNSDTVIERTSTAIPGGPHIAGATATVPVEMVALQLETVSPVNFMGFGLDNYFVTLQSARLGPASVGSTTITFDGTGLAGTFAFSIDVAFDVRKGSLNGPILLTDTLTATSSGTPWSDLAPASALAIDGVNQFLSGTSGDATQDIWATAEFTMTQTNGATHELGDATVPEPGTLTMMATAGAIGLLVRRRIRK